MSENNLIIGYFAKNKNWRLINLTGQKFNKWTVFGYAGRLQGTRSQPTLWLCRCDCGTWKTVYAEYLRSGASQSCGCWKSALQSKRFHIHGESGGAKNTPEYRAYKAARTRCRNPNIYGASSYSGRGIQFRFNSYEEFLQEVGRKPSPTHSLDRIDVNGHYEKGNIRWATPMEQSRNQRRNRWITAFGMTQCLADWQHTTGVKASTISIRIGRLNWCANCAVSIAEKTSTCHHR